MQNLARRFEAFPLVEELGTVTDGKGSTYMVETRSAVYTARQAVSCLIQPLVGDKVLVVGDGMEGFYILAVLERQEGQKQTLALHGDVDVRVEDGRLTVAADQGMDLACPKETSLTSSRMNVHCVDGELRVHQLVFSGGFWLGQVERLKFMGSIFDSIVERMSQRVKRSYRTVEDVDHLKAGRLDYLVDKLLSLRGKYSMLTAKEDVKIDGERIHMG